MAFMTAVALGTGSLKQEEAQRIIRSLYQVIGIKTQRPSLEQRTVLLAEMGIPTVKAQNG